MRKRTSSLTLCAGSDSRAAALGAGSTCGASVGWPIVRLPRCYDLCVEKTFSLAYLHAIMCIFKANTPGDIVELTEKDTH